MRNYAFFIPRWTDVLHGAQVVRTAEDAWSSAPTLRLVAEGIVPMSEITLPAEYLYFGPERMALVSRGDVYHPAARDWVRVTDPCLPYPVFGRVYRYDVRTIEVAVRESLWTTRHLSVLPEYLTHLSAPPVDYRHPTRPRLVPCETCVHDAGIAPYDALTPYVDDRLCAAHMPTCDRCGDSGDLADVTIPRADGRYGTATASWCEGCRDTYAFSCAHCEYTYLDSLGQSHGCGTICSGCTYQLYYCDHCDDSYCGDSCPNGCSDLSEWILDYGHRPIWQRHGRRGLPTFGFELEINADAYLAEGVTIPGLTFCKEDGSVSDGFEIVTHPMTLAYAQSEFPWHKLRELYAAGARAGGNGLHVHVGRDAFATASHLGRFLKLFYAHEENVVKIARRRCESYASFDPCSTRAVPLKAQAKGSTSGHRMVAVNTTNRETIEVRVFASTLNPEKVLAAIELVASMIEYTRTCRASEVTNWLAYARWADVQWAPDGTRVYSALMAQMEKRDCPTSPRVQVTTDYLLRGRRRPKNQLQFVWA